jgi:predicted 3-demethylubiquinone-9 3-methyltransferase (glyoxalase superfamily)
MISAPMPCIWFDDEAEAAAELWTSVVPNSRIVQTQAYPAAAEEVAGKPAGSVMTVDIELAGVRWQLLNGGPQFNDHDESVSFVLQCDTQQEIDELWDRLVEGGGEHGPCGWLKDRFGISWQVVPSGWDELVRREDPEAFERSMAAMLKMGKLDIAELRRAAEEIGAGTS